MRTRSASLGFILVFASIVNFTVEAKAQSVPIMVPIGCLMSLTCGDNGFEAAAKTSVVTSDDIARGGVTVFDATSSDAAVYGTNGVETKAAAAKLLADVRKELAKLTTTQLSSRKDQPAFRGIIGSAPDRLNDELRQYIAGSKYFNCKTSYEAMKRASEKMPAGRRRSDMLWALYPHFVESCYRGKLTELGMARDRIVVLLRKDRLRQNYSLYCLGFNFSANYVVTARHCLVEPGEVTLMLNRYKPSDPDASIEIDAPLRGTRALVLGEPDKTYSMRIPAAVEQERKFFPFAPENDIFILEIDDPERPEVSPFPIAESTASWDDISIPAIFPDDAVLSEAIESGNADRVSQVISGASAFDDGPMCSLVYPRLTKMPFLYHGCQTRFGYSGGPILRRDSNGALTLAGVHTGTVNAAKPIDNWPYRAYFPNYGLRLPPQVLSAAKAEAKRP